MLEEYNAKLSKSVLTPNGQSLLHALVKMYWEPEGKRYPRPSSQHQFKYSVDYLILVVNGCSYMEEDEINIEMQNLADGGYIQIDEKDTKRTQYFFKIMRPLVVNVEYEEDEEEDCY